MGKYFMGGTRLGGLERMMMDPGRTTPVHTAPRRKKPQKKLPCDRPVRPHSSERKA